MKWLALDIGGANLKAADGNGFAVSQPFPMWENSRNLVDALRTLIALAPKVTHVAATMTGELADCFTTEEDTWYFPRVAGTFKERAGFHGCQMPEQLLGRIIRLCSNPGDLVMDPFSGSATIVSKPSSSSRAAMAWPMLPSPMKPMVVMVSAFRWGERCGVSNLRGGSRAGSRCGS